jgi:hypothetical protein
MPDEQAGGILGTVPSPPPAQVQIVAGNPDEAEVAALVTVLSLLATDARAGRPGASLPAGPPVTGWAAYWRSVGAPMPTFPGAWAAAGVNRT